MKRARYIDPVNCRRGQPLIIMRRIQCVAFVRLSISRLLLSLMFRNGNNNDKSTWRELGLQPPFNARSNNEIRLTDQLLCSFEERYFICFLPRRFITLFNYIIFREFNQGTDFYVWMLSQTNLWAILKCFFLVKDTRIMGAFIVVQKKRVKQFVL